MKISVEKIRFFTQTIIIILENNNNNLTATQISQYYFTSHQKNSKQTRRNYQLHLFFLACGKPNNK
jgi:hypothetical protein